MKFRVIYGDKHGSVRMILEAKDAKAAILKFKDLNAGAFGLYSGITHARTRKFKTEIIKE